MPLSWVKRDSCDEVFIYFLFRGGYNLALLCHTKQHNLSLALCVCVSVCLLCARARELSL